MSQGLPRDHDRRLDTQLTPETSSAVHDSGLVVRYLPLPMTPAQEDDHVDDAFIGKW